MAVTATIVEPGALDSDEIQELVTCLDRLREQPRLVGPDGDVIELPVELYELLRHVAGELSRGHGVTVMPVSAVLTTAQAAELLNVSRPHVVKLIDTGKIPHHMVGTHRRLYLSDLLRYRDQQDQIRRAALAEIHAIADETGMDL